ncbi:MAG: hypothetical protein AAFU69_05030, partial [Pseudomonadota bacterium]
MAGSHLRLQRSACDKPLAITSKAAKERLAAERRHRQRITSKAGREARGQVQGHNTQANEFPDQAEAPSNQHEPGHQKIGLAGHGHSLGGGLASAGAISARRHKPELRIAARTYNAAGLHENTAARIPASLSA